MRRDNFKDTSKHNKNLKKLLVEEGICYKTLTFMDNLTIQKPLYFFHFITNTLLFILFY